MWWNIYKKKKLNGRCLGASGLMKASTCWEGGIRLLFRNRSSCGWDPHGPCPMYLFIWLFLHVLYNILYNKLGVVNSMFPWVLWIAIVKYQTWGGVMGTPSILWQHCWWWVVLIENCICQSRRYLWSVQTLTSLCSQLVRHSGGPGLGTGIWSGRKSYETEPLTCGVCTNAG